MNPTRAQGGRFRMGGLAGLACVISLAGGEVTSRGAAEAPATAKPGLPERPNIVLIIADDLGWSDLGCYGADLHETPHIDGLAASGLRFTQAYAPAPVCSPTRAALLTGQAPARLGITTWSEGAMDGPTDRRLRQAESKPNLPHTEITLAAQLQAAGYLTALVGKWHLGEADHAPETHGFDVNIGGTRWGAPSSYFWPYRGASRFGGEFRYVPHLEFGVTGEYLTDRLTEEAVRVVDRAVERSRPFFLMLAHHAPHTPIEAKADAISHFEARRRPGLRHQNSVYAAMIRSFDESVGRVLDHLRTRGLADSTVVVLTSDNGGYLGMVRRQSVPVTTNAPLRSGKGTLYEGGLRVPLIIRWPGRTRGGSLCHTPVLLTDLFYTLRPAGDVAASAVGGPGGPDGLDLAPVLREPDASLPRDALYFHFPHYYHAPPTAPVSAIRAGTWKLIEHLEDNRVELFDLERDPEESQDRAADFPGRAQEMHGRLASWRRAVGARMPTPNPEFPSPK